MTSSNSRSSSEAPGFSPARAARAKARALRSLIAVLTLVVLGATPHAQVQGSPQAPPRPAVDTGLIAGQVVDVDTGRGIPGAVVVGAVVTVMSGGGGQSSGTTAVVSDSQ